MSDEVASRREELLSSVREASEHNADALHSRFSPRSNNEVDGIKTDFAKGSFAIRLVICLTLFIGFYYMHETKTSVFKVTSDNIISEISNGVKADEVMSQLTSWMEVENK